MESQNRAVVYLDLLGFAALIEASPLHSITEPFDNPQRQTWPTNRAAERLQRFHDVLESRISLEQPNHAMVFSDCAFGVFYTPTACADFAVSLMRGFLQAKVPVRMGLGFGTFSSLGTTSAIRDRSTVVRAMFAGTSIVRAVAAEACGGKGMRIFVDRSFSDVFEQIPVSAQHQKRLSFSTQHKSVSCELDYVSDADPENINEWVASVKTMAGVAPPQVQDHYSDTLAALSRMLGYDVEDTRDLSEE